MGKANHDRHVFKRFRKSAEELLKAAKFVGTRRDRKLASAALRNNADTSDYPKMLRHTLLGLFFTGELTATLLVRLCFLITRAGGDGVSDLGREL
eukprot:8464093-Pyramimonas_sp.AAC.1